MNLWKPALLVIPLALCHSSQAFAHGTPVYVSQSGGVSSGGSACDGQKTISVAAFNGTTYDTPGTMIYLCGVIASPISYHGNGATGNPNQITFDKGARLTVTPSVCGNETTSICFNTNGAAHLVIDGGTPCGPGTACANAEAADPTGYPAEITGVMEMTDSGTGYPNQYGTSGHQASPYHSFAMLWVSGEDTTVENLICRNTYVHTSLSDEVYGGGGAIVCIKHEASTFTAQDNTIHDTSSAIDTDQLVANQTFERNNLYNFNWGISGGTTGTETQGPWYIHDNHFGPMTAFDTDNNTAHHDGLMIYADTTFKGYMDGLYVYNNLWDGDPGVNATANVYLPSLQASNCYFFNNVFNPSVHGLANSQITASTAGAETATTGCEYYNNTVLGPPAYLTTVRGSGCVTMGGTIVWENNISSGCFQLVYLQTDYHVASGGGPFIETIDYNTYGPGDVISGGYGYLFENDATSGTNHGYSNTLARWQASTGSEAHSTYTQSGIELDAEGIPQTGSPAVASGTNLTSLCSRPYLSALCSDTSAGNTRTPTSRSATAAHWDTGAFNFGASPLTELPAPPSKLTVTVQ
jgi:hypothetical protein